MTTDHAADHAADVAALRELFAHTIEAWGRGDAEAFGAAFTEDADYVIYTGTHYRGRRKIVDVHDALWARLLQDASRQRVAALRGRLQPETTESMACRRSWLRLGGPHLLVHSRHREITNAIQRGSAFLSRLDGEWWIRIATG